MIASGCGDKRREASGQGSPDPGANRGSATVPTPGDPLASLTWDAMPLDWSRPVANRARDLSGFAGSQSCKPCHEKIYASYAKHSMARTGMRPIESVDQKWIGALFDAGTEVVHARSGYSYTPSRRAGRYIVTESLLGADGYQNDGDNEITGIHVSNGDPSIAGLIGTGAPTPFEKGWRVFYTRQHGRNITFEIVKAK